MAAPMRSLAQQRLMGHTESAIAAAAWARPQRHFCSGAAQSQPRNDALQRRTNPRGVPELPGEARRIRSVGQMHAEHCAGLAKGGAPRDTKAATAAWEWAGLRVCKLAYDMRPEDLVACAVAFALGDRRDMRTLYVLAEIAITQRMNLGADDIGEMLAAYARLNIRNEPLFESLGGRLMELLEEAEAMAEAGDGSAVLPVRDLASVWPSALGDNTVEPATLLGEALILTLGPVLEQALASAVTAHAQLGLEGLPTFAPLVRSLVPSAHVLDPGVAARVLRAQLLATAGRAMPATCIAILATAVEAATALRVEKATADYRVHGMPFAVGET